MTPTIGEKRTHPGFRKGEKLICVWDWAPAKAAFPDMEVPEMGRTYTVRVLIPPEPKNDAPFWAVLLEEIRNPLVVDVADHEAGFNAEGFLAVRTKEDHERVVHFIAEAPSRRQ